MSDDSETVEDTKKGSLTEVSDDDSCTLEFIEIAPLDRPREDYHTSEFIYPPVVLLPPEALGLREIDQDLTDDNDSGDSCYYVKQELTGVYETESPCFSVQVSSMLFFFASSVKPQYSNKKLSYRSTRGSISSYNIACCLSF